MIAQLKKTMAALNNLIEEGKVRAIGASAMYGYQFQNMQHIAEEKETAGTNLWQWRTTITCFTAKMNVS